MSFSFSQPQTSSFLDPNELLNLQTLRDAPQVAADIHQNRLLAQQQAQQEISSHELEMGARLAGTIWAAGDTPEARAAAYPTYLAQARAMAPGYFKNAPATYPGDAATQALMRMGTPSEKLFQLGQASQDATGFANRWGPQAAAPAAPAAATGGSGGTTAPPGTSTPTAPQNLADIHPDLTQFTLPSGVGVTVAKSVAPQFQGLLTDLEAAGYKLDPNTTGGYNPRTIAGTNTPSQHAYGLAMDVNWQRNPRGANTQADIPPDLARKLAAKWGLTWGGDWQGADRDPMHFEVARGSGPGTDHPTGVATGWKANNPLNLTTDTGGVVTPGGARLASFGSMADGVAATAAKLQSYQTDRGLNTVRQMYTEWHKGSPVNEADMQRVAGAMGVGVDQPFQLDPTKTAAWITAAQPGETGTAGKRLSQADITAGVRQAAAAPAVAPGGVAARTGGTDVAGPGAGSGASTAPPAALPRDQAVAQAQPTIPPPPEVLSNGLTREQTAEIPALRRAVQLGQKTLAEADKQLLDYQAANRAAQRQYTLDVQAQQKAATEQARQAEELRLRQEADKRTAAEAEVKAKQAAQPFQGTGMDPQWQNILDKGDDGSAKYARAYTAAAAPKYNPADGSWVKPNMAAYDKPTFVPKGMTEPPDYTKQEVPTPTIMTAPQTLAAGYADRMRNALPVISDTSPAAMSRWQQLLGQIPLAGNTFVSSDFQQHVQAERDFINAVLRRESGAAISEPEFINARQQYIPQPGDKPAVLAQKQKNRETVMANLVRDAGPAYRPPTGSATEPPASTPPSRVIRYDHTGKRIEE